MKASQSAQKAKEFLISQIVEEAQQEGVPLSEVERKMLYFTESRWTLPDIMKVNEDFDREYDQDEYEHKIAKLIAKAYKRICKGSRDDYDRWWGAIRFLRRGDHYILVMIQLAGLKPRGDQLRLLATALGIVTLILMWAFLSAKYNVPVPSRDSIYVALWIIVASLFIAYTLLRFIFGKKRTDDLTSGVIEKLGRVCQRISRSS